MNVKKATRQYEAWLGERLTLIPVDLELKHKQMADDLFPFMRATYYRWAQLIPKICPDLANAPEVLAVGDLHIENFGTWRDSEGRLIWGISDFDEAYPMPYAYDLVRLVTSAVMAISAGHFSLSFKDACAAILAGYTEHIEQEGKPFVLAEHNDWLRRLATSDLRSPVEFWKKLR